MTDRRLDDLLSDNERLRHANEALRARIERHGQLGADGVLARLEQADPSPWARRMVEAALDASTVALALFSEEGRLVAVNHRLAALFSDVAPRMTPGLRFDEAMRTLAGAALLGLPDAEARAAWARARVAARGGGAGPATMALTDGRLIETAERRAGHGAFALAFQEVTRALADASGGPATEAGSLARLALDHLSLGVAAFDGAGRLEVWSAPFRAMLGVGVGDLARGAPLSALAERIAEHGAVDPAGPFAEIGRWVAAPPPRPALRLEIARRDGASLLAQARSTDEGGFVLSLSDVTAERRAAAEVERVRRTLEARVGERTAALVEVNDRLVQEVAERRAIEAEMRRARDAAEAANLSKTRFLAAASHDLLQPLNAAKLFVSALSASELRPGEAALALKIESAFASVETLLNALLDISKLDAGGGEADPVDFPIARILQPVADEFRPVAAERGLRLRVAPSEAVVRSDPHYLRRIVQNLVSNALKYTVQGGVVVGCRRRGGAVRIEVWDSGVGIPATERRRIFEEFHRIETANPRGERGMGLGLAIVERASRLLGHSVDIRSAEGVGSVFAVTVPRGDPAAARRRHAARPARIGFAGESGMIALVIEDDPSVRAATVALLARWGVDALEAASGDEALDAARRLGVAPDVALVDYHLRDGETGVDALRRLRAALGARIPAILITADRSRATAEAAAAEGAQLLTKPVAPAKLRALLQWSRAERAAAAE